MGNSYLKGVSFFDLNAYSDHLLMLEGLFHFLICEKY